MLLVLILITFLDNVSSDYENTWNFYYEQPCCGNVNGQHHLRHHRGIILHFILFFYLCFLFEKWILYVENEVNIRVLDIFFSKFLKSWKSFTFLNLVFLFMGKCLRFSSFFLMNYFGKVNYLMMISQEGGDICNYVSIYRVMVNVFYSSMRLKAGINHYVK